MKINQNQDGFSIIEILLVIVMAAGLVAAGWYVRGKQEAQSSTKTAEQSSSANQSTAQKKEVGNQYIGDWFKSPPKTVIESANKSFSMVPPGGWSFYLSQDKDMFLSSGSSINGSAYGGFLEAPAEPLAMIYVTGKTFSKYENIFAIYTESTFVQQDTNEKAVVSDFGPVDGVVGKRYFQKNEKGGGDDAGTYEYSFAKNDKIYHIFYKRFISTGTTEFDESSLDRIETAIRTIKFNK